MAINEELQRQLEEQILKSSDKFAAVMSEALAELGCSMIEMARTAENYADVIDDERLRTALALSVKRLESVTKRFDSSIAEALS